LNAITAVRGHAALIHDGQSTGGSYDAISTGVERIERTIAQVGSSVLRGAPARALKTSIGGGYMGRIGAIENAARYVHESVHGH
jgi:hypothetical protein